MKYDPTQKPSLDASLGLIYRLNLLWQRVDIPASTGDYDKWNFLLDRIFCNLMYKNEFDITHDGKGNVKEVKFSEEDEEVFQYLNKQVIEATKKLKLVKTKQELHIAKLNLYNALMMKDIGLRKFMHIVLKLYMKHSDKNPSRAMWE